MRPTVRGTACRPLPLPPPQSSKPFYHIPHPYDICGNTQGQGVGPSTDTTAEHPTSQGHNAATYPQTPSFTTETSTTTTMASATTTATLSVPPIWAAEPHGAPRHQQSPHGVPRPTHMAAPRPLTATSLVRAAASPAPTSTIAGDPMQTEGIFCYFLFTNSIFYIAPPAHLRARGACLKTQGPPQSARNKHERMYHHPPTTAVRTCSDDTSRQVTRAGTSSTFAVRPATSGPLSPVSHTPVVPVSHQPTPSILYAQSDPTRPPCLDTSTMGSPQIEREVRRWLAGVERGKGARTRRGG